MRKNTSERRRNTQKILFCVTQLKEAHFTEQTDHPSPGTDVLDKGTHLAVTHTKAVARSCKGGRVGRTPLGPVQVQLGKKIVPIL